MDLSGTIHGSLRSSLYHSGGTESRAGKNPHLYLRSNCGWDLMWECCVPSFSISVLLAVCRGGRSLGVSTRTSTGEPLDACLLVVVSLQLLR